jgi:hypothetical protein
VGDPPDNAINALQALISRLRRALSSGVVVTETGGYRLALEGGEHADGGGLARPVGAQQGDTAPGRATRSTPSSAVVSPKRLTSPSTQMAPFMAASVPATPDISRPRR